MCDPVTLSLAAAAASTALGAYGAFASSQGQASALKMDATNEQNKGYQDESDFRAKAKVDLADQLAALSTRGTSISSGTPLALLQQSARNQELDALQLRAAGINKANALRYQASNVLRSGWISAGAQVLAGTSKLGELGAFNGGGSSDGAGKGGF